MKPFSAAALVAAAAPILAAAAWYQVVAGRRSQLLGRSVFRGPGHRRSIALTFDDGPTPQTLELAHFLEREGVRATFFVCGINVRRHPDIVRHLIAHGHEIGNHTWSHRRLCPRLGWRVNLLRPRTVFQEIADAQQEVLRATELRPTLLRAPYGLRWWGMRRAQRQFGLLHVFWTVIGHDWEWPPLQVASHVLRHAAPGGIVCLHDGRDSREAPDIAATLQAVRQIVPELKRRHFRFETVTELLRPDPRRGHAAVGSGNDVSFTASSLEQSSPSVASGTHPK